MMTKIKTHRYAKVLNLLLGSVLLIFSACRLENKETDTLSNLQISPDNAGLSVPEGFGVIKVADSHGKPRHIAVTTKGGIFIKLRQAIDGKGVLFLEDNDNDGIAD
ncbi:MAG: hypothetical protein HUJ11_02520, partial [Arenibacter algicola]|nr:hypothetical protein [Arenibacter algicola]